VAIVKPAFSVSTKKVYEAYDSLSGDRIIHPDIDGLIDAINEGDLYKMCTCMGNSLESVTEKEHTLIAEIKRILEEKGAVKAMMSGSGPTVFAIFDDKDKANSAISVFDNNERIEMTTVVKFLN
ncbi:MAG: 4-(cytidine 5'-diphospho)-2-C-methyl-D-erythritol kinase, partial [Lachnospiraceae bacterium]|nr:4-(cytidine 5'-diphospho)-2-C-methyl-D-erythritol kinase [Lachnospiraceae bacterium]